MCRLAVPLPEAEQVYSEDHQACLRATVELSFRLPVRLQRLLPQLKN